MTFPRHTHTPKKDSQGRMICSTCRSLVLNPIRDSDDPRLQGAGFQRGGIQEEKPISDALPLPVVLIGLYFQYESLDVGQAPVSWYVDTIAQKEGENIGNNDLWDVLYEEWLEQWLNKSLRRNNT